MRLRTFFIVAALAAAGLLLGACGGDDEPAATPTASAPAEATPIPTATPLSRIPDPIVVSAADAPGSGASEDAVEYVVEAGDTISGISDRFGVDADLIREVNDIQDDAIFIGQTLLIPRGGTVPDTDGASEPTPAPIPTDGTYVVQEGDTAFGIALEFDTTVEALAAANGMTEDEIENLQIGQVINLPSPE